MDFAGRARNRGDPQTEYERTANHDSLGWYGFLTDYYGVTLSVPMFIRHKHGTSVSFIHL